MRKDEQEESEELRVHGKKKEAMRGMRRKEQDVKKVRNER